MIVLLQFRSDAAGWHEVQCFYEVLNVPYSELCIINLFNPEINWVWVERTLKTASKIVLGGSGETGYEHPDDVRFFDIVSQLHEVLSPIIEDGKHIFGVCLGHQILADILGGDVEPSPQHEETGIVPLKALSTAKDDPLFAKLPPNFFVATAHKTSVLGLPNKVTVLATNANSPVQAFRYKNTWGVQYHPELDDEKLNFRLALYKTYVRNQLDEIETRDFTHAKKVIRNFIALKE